MIFDECFSIGRISQMAYALRVIFEQFKFHYVSSLFVASMLAFGPSCARNDGATNASDEGEKVVSKVNLDPGIDLWLGEEKSPEDIERMIEKFPLYAVHHERYALSQSNLKLVRGKRELVIPALRARIENAAKKAIASPASASSIPVLEFELTLALDLNAVELLDVITGAARQLHTGLVDFETGKLETYLATSHADLHRNFLSALSGILRQEGYGPVTNEEWGDEFTYEKAVDEFAGNLLDPNTSLTEESEDPRFPVAGMAPFTADFSEKLIDWAQDFLATTPAGDRKGATGMEQPVPSWK